MFIIAQIPFVDLRLLSSDSRYKKDGCIFPNTFEKRAGHKIYYRYLGTEKLRSFPGELPTPERMYFDSSKILSLNESLPFTDKPYCPKLLFARLFEDAQFFHFDIGIRENSYEKICRKDLGRFIHQFMSAPLFKIRKGFDRTGTSYCFTELVEQVRQIYLYATRDIRKNGTDKINDKSLSRKVITGSPALFITYNKNEVHTFGKAKKITMPNGIEIWHDLTAIDNIPVNVWLIGKNDLPKYHQELRNLRIYLSKLHSYKESVRIILDELAYPNDFSRDKLIYFFEFISSYLHREKYYGYPTEDFWSLIFSVDDTFNHMTWENYKRRIDAYLNAFKVKTMNINKGIINYGNTGSITYTSIHDTANSNITITVPPSDNSIQEQMKAFDVLVQELLANNQLTGEQLQRLEDNIDSFKDCITAKKADKDTASKMLSRIKKAFGDTVSIAAGIEKLISIGKSIISLLT